MATMTSDPGSADEPYPLPRIGDAERQAAVDELSEHFVAGRLDDAEFNQRMDAALQARTVADLIPLFADLPGLNPGAPWAQAPTPAASALPVPLPYAGPDGYQPATSPRPGQVEAGWVNVLRTVRPIIWPVAIGLMIFTHIPAGLLIVAAIVLTIVSSRVLGDRKHRRDLPRGNGGGPQLPPGQ